MFKLWTLGRATKRQAVLTFIPAFLVLGAIVLASILSDTELPQFTRDVAVVANVHPLSGLLSNLGILLWCATASICLFSGMILRVKNRKEVSFFLIYSAILSAYLTVDDAFLIHEDLASRYLNVDEKLVILFIITLVSLYLFRFYKIILRTDYALFACAFGLLACSVVWDSFPVPVSTQWDFLIEDGMKWLGIAAWCSYYVRVSYRFVLDGLLNLEKTAAFQEN